MHKYSSLLLGCLLAGLGASGWCAEVDSAAVEKAIPAKGADIFAHVRPSVVALRTSLTDSDHWSSAGSGFQVDERGWAITNFHVVAEYLFGRDKYALHYRLADGQDGLADVIAVDVIDDLALVAPRKTLAREHVHPLGLPEMNRLPAPAQGDSVFAIGNPLNLGVTITSGSYSGIVSGSFERQIHYTGVLNPGMSGGPAVDAQGHLVGVNVAHQVNAESVSFLVPIEHAVHLYQSAQKLSKPLADFRAVITHQLDAEQARQSRLAFAKPWETEPFGNYRVPDILTDYSDCGAASNQSSDAPPPVERKIISCSFKTSTQPVDGEISSFVTYKYTLVQARKSLHLNAFQLAAAADPVFREGVSSPQSTTAAPQQCQDRLTYAGPRQDLPVRLLWCAQAYRDFPGIYDFQIAVSARKKNDAVLVTRLTLAGFNWQNALGFTQRLLEGIQ
jgi:S1-C subfamily serine protease